MWLNRLGFKIIKNIGIKEEVLPELLLLALAWDTASWTCRQSWVMSLPSP